VFKLVPGTPPRLHGYYVNERDPEPGKAHVELEWKSLELQNSLGEKK
jgi:hypothetical protein